MRRSTRWAEPHARAGPAPGAAAAIRVASPRGSAARRLAGVLCCAVSGCAGEPAVEPSGLPPGPRIVIDGRFDDWAACVERPDPADAPGAELDIRAVCVADDAEALYLSLDLGREVNVQGLRGTLSLRLDADGDTTTGAADGPVAGADLVVQFSPPDPARPGARREGVGLTYPPAGAAREAAESEDASTPHPASEPYHLGLFFEPRHTARRIEIRLERGVLLPGGVVAFRGARVRGMVEHVDSAGRTVDVTAPFSHEWEPAPGAAAARPAGEATVARRRGTAFRALSWNVSQTALVEQAERFRRVLRALEPDLVLLDEVAADTEPEWLSVFFGSLGEGWRIHRGSSGGRERQVIALRAGVAPAAGGAMDPGPDPAPELARLAYPDSLPRAAEPPAREREVAVTAPAEGVPATGAWVTIDGRRLLVVSLDLRSGGNRPDSPQERARRIEADVIRGAAARALRRPPRAGVDGVIVGGDFNLVGTEIPLTRMAEGLDPSRRAPAASGNALEAVYALQLDGRSTATWDGRSGPFPPGQLDYVLYSPSSLVPLAAFVLETGDMDPEWLAAHGLAAEDSRLASDHLPIVVDFAWRTP